MRLAGRARPRTHLRRLGPLPRPERVAGLHVKGSRSEEGAWTVFDKRYWPGDEFGDHLGLARRQLGSEALILTTLVLLPLPDGISARSKLLHSRTNSEFCCTGISFTDQFEHALMTLQI